ncbi:MAG: hypothetical protein EZS28_005870 [Streblomastix strix]|uniref:Uncharacterized protein n=1 Tax=Streblomastix strix TaxID=222440 RepID=A0A5J4WVT1_9EUKA|nr:MAG: hypothetical protein EZS28_005870 [Streblomastix strix]
MYCGSDWIQYLLNSSYISGLTNWISLSGGSQIQSNLLIREGIVGIVVFFTRINDIDDTQLSFNLHKQFQEQNEYQGQSEEIEAHLFSIKYQGSKISIQEDAERTKRFLTMAYKWVFAI